MTRAREMVERTASDDPEVARVSQRRMRQR